MLRQALLNPDVRKRNLGTVLPELSRLHSGVIMNNDTCWCGKKYPCLDH